MSDFIEHLINRHIGNGEMMLPRARAKFEPDAAAAFLPQDIEEESQRLTLPTPDINPPANEWDKAHDDCSSSKAAKLNKSFCGSLEPHDMGDISSPLLRTNSQDQRASSKSSPMLHGAESIKQPVQDQPESLIQSMEVDIPVYPSVSGLTAEPANKEKKKVLPDEHDAAGHPPPEFVRQEVTEKSSLLPVEQRDYLKPGYPVNPIHIVMNKTQEAPDDQRSQQPQPKAPELFPSTGLTSNLSEPEQVMAKSQPVFTGIHNTGMEDTGTEVEGMLEAPAWLPEKQHELHKGLVVNDSKVETEPIINVTIGRIEVRANQSPAPEQTRKKKKPSGVMSLETYLSQCR